MIEEADVLLAIAEIAALFIGLSSIIFVLERQKTNKQRLVFLRSVAETGLAALFGSLMPLQMIRIIGDTALGWRVSAGVAIVVWGISWFGGARSFRDSGVSASFGGKLYSPDNILNLSGLGLLAWAAIGLPPYAGTLYTIAMTLLLALTALTFIARAFVPVGGTSS